MASLFHVIIFSLIGGVFSLIGGIILLSDKKRAQKLALYATPFAAGALLAAAFFDLLPEATHVGDVDTALTYTLVGIVGFFLLERYLRVFHHHHDHKGSGTKSRSASLIVIGDTLHNFIDGIAIAAGFLIDVNTGIVVTIAVAAHEIPQEIGDFGILLRKKMSRRDVLLVNVLSALASLIAAVIFFQIGETTDLPLDALLGLVAGMFIYIAASDIIPSIHETKKNQVANWQTAMLLIGLLLVGVVTSWLHQYIDQGHDDHHHSAEVKDEHDESHDEDEEHQHEEEYHDEETDKDHSDEEHHDEDDHHDKMESKSEEHHEDEHSH